MITLGLCPVLDFVEENGLADPAEADQKLPFAGLPFRVQPARCQRVRGCLLGPQARAGRPALGANGFFLGSIAEVTQRLSAVSAMETLTALNSR